MKKSFSGSVGFYLCRFLAPLVVLGGMLVYTPSLALADANSTSQSSGTTTEGNGNGNGGVGNGNGNGNDHSGDGRGGGNQNGGGPATPSVPETPYAAIFPVMLAGVAYVIYKRRSKPE